MDLDEEVRVRVQDVRFPAKPVSGEELRAREPTEGGCDWQGGPAFAPMVILGSMNGVRAALLGRRGRRLGGGWEGGRSAFLGGGGAAEPEPARRQDGLGRTDWWREADAVVLEEGAAGGSDKQEEGEEGEKAEEAEEEERVAAAPAAAGRATTAMETDDRAAGSLAAQPSS